MEIALRRVLARSKRRRPPNRRRLLHAIYLAVILGWVARAGLLIASDHNVVIQLLMLPAWVLLYRWHHKLSRAQADPHPAEWWGAGFYVLVSIFLWII